MNSEESSYADLISALNNAAIITETDLGGRIISVNEQFCQLSGYSESELVGAPHNIVNSGTHPKNYFSEMWKIISSGNVWIGEVCNRAKDGHLYWLHATIFPVFGKILVKFINMRRFVLILLKKRNRNRR